MKNCPGYYCGQFRFPNGTLSECGACPRGWRIDDYDLCQPCQEEPSFYDWLYLIFMFVMPLLFHWYYIDYKIHNPVLSKKLTISAILETVLSVTATILLMEPKGSFKLNSCRVTSLSDWYSFMYNPAPFYEDYIYCTQEVVYPLYTMIFVFYVFGVASLLFIRPWFIDKNVSVSDTNSGISTFYAGLYLFPILALIHAVFCGFIYSKYFIFLASSSLRLTIDKALLIDYLFPYYVIIISVISNAVHFSLKLDQSMSYLIRSTITSTRNLFIVLMYWVCHAFGIIGITQLTDPILHYPLLCLIPVPTLFYILTSRLTDPRKLNLE